MLAMTIDSEPDDLQQILGYHGAADDSAGDEPLGRLGDEIYRTPFWTPRFCATVIRAAEAVGAFEPQDDDPVPGHEVSLAVISPALYGAFEQDLGMRLWPRLQGVWPYVDYHGLRDAFVIKYELGRQRSLRIHHDIAQLSASIKLNDGYEGAVLEFPRQGVDNADQLVGELIAWPSLVTHPHQTSELISGTKYALTIWFELPAV
jgi:hypothetical protein